MLAYQLLSCRSWQHNPNMRIWIDQSMPSGDHVANTGLEKRLEELRADFASLTGAPFQHFFCPVLFVDEDAALCKGHVVSQAFPSSTRRWTVQRKDVDSFYGSYFETDFQALLYREGGTPASVLFDKKLSRSFDVPSLWMASLLITTLPKVTYPSILQDSNCTKTIVIACSWDSR